MSDLNFPPLTDVNAARQISPTDVSQFIRLEQCQRYLRLRLHGRAFGTSFMRTYDVVPQAIPPLLTRSGADFEQQTEAAVRQVYDTVNLADERPRGTGWTADTERVLAEIRAVPAGATRVLIQPRLQVVIADWSIRGDVDILRLHRTSDGDLQIMITDMKSSTAARIEYRLQVAFYHRMLSTLLDTAAIPYCDLSLSILYRGTLHDNNARSQEEQELFIHQHARAQEMYATQDGYLEEIADPEHYLGVVDDLVIGRHSVAREVAAQPFEDVPYHLTYKCDGCLFNEFCMKWSAEHDDLSLLPYLTAQEKTQLQREGITTTAALATVKQPSATDRQSLDVTPGNEQLVARLASMSPLGSRLDELVHRARVYQRRLKHNTLDSINWIPGKGYGSLPYNDAQQNPNLVRIYIDSQHDYLNDRIYMLGALLVGCENGEETRARRRTVVHITEGPPDTPERERELFVRWISEVLHALAEVAAPDEDGKPNAPIHLIFYNSYEQRLLLDGLMRHFSSVNAAVPLFDFVTQIAAFDSTLITYLDREIREQKNYPMVCQSLQAVAAYLRFDWNQPEPYRDLFRTRMFDFWGRLDRNDSSSDWYTNRTRFNSHIPLEYVYGAWGDLETPEEGEPDDYRRYRGVTVDQVCGFQRRRLEAIEHVAKDFIGNRRTSQKSFHIPDLADFEDRATGLASALHEFLIIERHVELSAWKNARLAPPERRVLAGESLIVRYYEEDQDPGVAAVNREYERRRIRRLEYEEAYLRDHPEAARVELTKEQREECRWSVEGQEYWLRLEVHDIGCGLDEILGLTTLREGDSILLSPRWTVDSRKPEAEQVAFTPTPRQMLYMQRGRVKQFHVDRDRKGRARSARVRIELSGLRYGGKDGFVFNTNKSHVLPLATGTPYVIDKDPNNWNASFLVETVEAMEDGSTDTLFERLESDLPGAVPWPRAAAEAQQQFMRGLDALQQVGAFHAVEIEQRQYISEYGDAPILLVQGPPGTGKSYSTAFALLARIQGALAAGIPYRVFISCKTHAAVDVLLNNVCDRQAQLRQWFTGHPRLSAQYFDRRLLDIPLFRLSPHQVAKDPIVTLPRKRDTPPGSPKAIHLIHAQPQCVVAGTPGGIRGLLVDHWQRANMYGQDVADCLVLDEASQMNLPEAIMAAIPLKADGQIIVVGDHRQMPPIVQHDWQNESRRTFQQYRIYRSLFETLWDMELPRIQFRESFRLHRDMAAFLEREIYRWDNITFFSRRTDVLAHTNSSDDFVRAVLTPQHPIVVVVHEEKQSQISNPFEQAIIEPIIRSLEHLPPNGLDIGDGFGVVVPHRAQRAELLDRMPSLTSIDPDTGEVLLRAVDTVERFQGGERTAILVSATESDPQYLLMSSEFLLDPRRLTVALSRARSKMILVAARSIFTLFSSDEEVFANAQIWKDLLRSTCTVPLWAGMREQHQVEVWGNIPSSVDFVAD